MICLTADAHQASLKNSEHSLGYSKEHLYAKKYLQITKRYRIKTTLYVTGREILDHSQFWKKISERKDVLLGGHTFDAFQTKNISRIIGKPIEKLRLDWQDSDICRTIESFKSIGIRIEHWRGHGYVHYDEKLLRKYGIRTASDYIMYDVHKPEVTKKGRLSQVPITVLPDHENFNHGAIDWKWLDIKGWCEVVIERVEYLEKKRLPSVLLIHPCCMGVANNFRTFRKICRELSKYEPGFISEVA